ncbi:MAG: acyltransferase [Acetobacteraceae bacterium]
MTTPTRAANTAEIKSLTGLRGIAAAYVVAFHFTGNGEVGSGAVRTFMSHGYLAVDVFFVLSGFVMAINYGPKFSHGFQSENYLVFLVKRVGRVYPLFLATTLVCAALSVVDPGMEGGLTGWTLATNLLMIQAWGLSYSLNYPGWSISTEFSAYLLFPVLAMTLLGPRRAVAFMTSSLAVGLLIFVATRSAAELHEGIGHTGPLNVWASDTLYPVLRCLAGFSLGMLAWRASNVPALQRLSRHPAAGLALLVVMATLIGMPDTDVLLVLLCVPLMIVLAAQQTPVARWLAWQPIHWLGVISYSLYLVHYPVRWSLAPVVQAALDALHVPFRGAVLSTLYVLLSLGVATIAYHAIEKPGRDLSRTFLRGRRQLAVAAVPTAREG